MPSLTIYAKTQKGFEEMTRRTCRLPARMHALLIMIDGCRPAAEVFAQTTDPAESQQLIDALLENGFIETVGEVAPPGVPSSGAAAPSASGDSQATRDHGLAAAKRYIVQAMRDALGPDADHFTSRVDAAEESTSIKAVALQYLDVIRSASDRRKADAFRDGLVRLHLLSPSEGLPEPLTEPPIDLRAAKRVMVQLLVAALGPDADRFTLAAERVTGADELRALLAKYQEVVRTMAGPKKADEFVAAVSAALIP